MRVKLYLADITTIAYCRLLQNNYALNASECGDYFEISALSQFCPNLVLISAQC
jgi:hypothetical protein